MKQFRADHGRFGAIVSAKFTIVFATSLCSMGLANAHGGDSHDTSAVQMLSTQTGSGLSRFSLGLNLSSSQKFKEEPKTDGHSDHSSAMNENVINASVGYRLTNRIGLNLMAGASSVTGAQDPTLGPSYSFDLPWKKWRGFAFSSVGAPVSKSSRDQGRFLTVNLGTGIGRSNYKSSFSFSVFTAIPTYPTSDSARPAAERGTLSNSGIDPTHLPSNSGDGHHHDDASPEKYRVGSSLKAGMRLTGVIRVESGFELSFIEKYFNPMIYESELLVSRLSYFKENWEAGLSFLLKDEFEQLRVPTLPVGRFNLSVSM